MAIGKPNKAAIRWDEEFRFGLVRFKLIYALLPLVTLIMCAYETTGASNILMSIYVFRRPCKWLGLMTKLVSSGIRRGYLRAPSYLP